MSFENVSLTPETKYFHTGDEIFHRSRKNMKHFQTTSKEIIEPKHFLICLFLHLFSGVEVFHPFVTVKSLILLYCIVYTVYSILHIVYTMHPTVTSSWAFDYSGKGRKLNNSKHVQYI